jgi:hypothetical protein
MPGPGSSERLGFVASITFEIPVKVLVAQYFARWATVFGADKTNKRKKDTTAAGSGQLGPPIRPGYQYRSVGFKTN